MRRAFASLFLLFCLSAHAQELPLKGVELEWDPVENAFGYEVRLTPKAGGTPLTYRVLENKFAQDVPVGVYILRIRSRHKEVADFWSPWSDPITLDVLVKELLTLAPADEAVLESKGGAREEVTFMWTKIDKARDYVLKIWTEETKDKPLTFFTRKNSQRLKLLPGRVYYWQVVFDSATQVTYAQEVRTSMFMLQGPKLIQPSINEIPPLTEIKELSWVKVPKAKAYKAKLSYHYLDEAKFEKVDEAELTEPKWTFKEKLKPGVYKVEVIATAPRHANSDPGILEFTVKPTEAELTQALR
jgi:hypothetical protein